MVLRQQRWILSRLRLSGVSPLREVPREFAVVQLRLEFDRTAGVFRNRNAEVRHIRRTRLNELHVENAAGLPRVAFVDGIRSAVQLIGLIEMGAGFDRTLAAFAVVFNLAAPEDRAAVGVFSL